MNLPWLPCLAQADLARLSGLEYDLAQKAVLIGTVYAAILILGLAADVGLVLLARTRRWPWREGVSALVWRPDGGRLAFGCEDGAAGVLNFEPAQ